MHALVTTDSGTHTVPAVRGVVLAESISHEAPGPEYSRKITFVRTCQTSSPSIFSALNSEAGKKMS